MLSEPRSPKLVIQEPLNSRERNKLHLRAPITIHDSDGFPEYLAYAKSLLKCAVMEKGYTQDGLETLLAAMVYELIEKDFKV